MRAAGPCCWGLLACAVSPWLWPRAFACVRVPRLSRGVFRAVGFACRLLPSARVSSVCSLLGLLAWGGAASACVLVADCWPACSLVVLQAARSSRAQAVAGAGPLGTSRGPGTPDGLRVVIAGVDKVKHVLHEIFFWFIQPW